MRAVTKYFGEVDIDDDKVLTMPEGLIGFPDFTKYALVFDHEDQNPIIKWFQSLDEPILAIPIIDPALIMPEYTPVISENIAGVVFSEQQNDDFIILVTMVIPSDIENMTANMKAPIIINTKTKQACQVIVDNAEYEIKYKIYDILKKNKEQAGE